MKKMEPPHTDHEDDRPHLLNKRFIRHANTPRNIGQIQNPSGMAKGVGTCGDALAVYISVERDEIADIRQLPHGCTYTVACGSAMSCLVKGKVLAEALQVTPEKVAAELGGLPEDHMHCASLAINTLGEAIDDYYQKIWGNADKVSGTEYRTGTGDRIPSPEQGQ